MPHRTRFPFGAFLFCAAILISTPGTLLAQPVPVITSQPQSKSALVGTNVSFTVVASGQSPLSYRWYFNGTNLVDSVRMSGATSPMLTISNLVLSDTGSYSAVVSNKHGIATSSNAVLTVNVSPAIELHPQGQNVLAGSTATFSAGASGNPPPVYQWFFNELPLSGETTSTLSVNNADASHEGNYFVVASNTLGTATSSNAFLTVNFPPTLTAEPQSLTVFDGTNVTFSATASGSCPLNFQWQFNGLHILNATNSALVLTNVQLTNSGDFRVTVTNAFGSATSSNAALLVLIAPPVIQTQPQTQTVAAGASVTLQVSATGRAPLSYQWFHNGVALNGRTNLSFQITNAQSANAGDYFVEVGNAGGTTPSSNAMLTVNPAAPIFSLAPTSLSVVPGAEVSFSSRAIGTEPITYQWEFNDVEIPGATQSALVLTNVQNNGGTYKSVAMNAVGTNSAAATLTFVAPPGFLWARKGGSTLADEGKCVAVDTNGNVYVAGSFSGNSVFATSNLTSFGGTDIFLAKYDSFGQLLWLRQAGGISGDAANAIAFDPEGNVVLTGYSFDVANFSGILVTNYVDSRDTFIAKYDSDGEIIFAKKIGSFGHDQGNGIAVDSAGNIFVAGSYSGPFAFGSTITNAGGSDAFIFKCDPDGIPLWVKRAGGTSTDVAQSVGVDRNGNVFIGGYFQSASITLDGIVITNATVNFPDIFVAKYDGNGNVLWAKRAGGVGGGTEQATAIGIDDIGNLFVTGHYTGTAIFDGATITSIGSSTDVFLAKYDVVGNLTWVRSAGGSSIDYGNALVIDRGGNAYLAGRFNGSATFPPAVLNSLGGDDIFVAAYSAAGNGLWARRAGGSLSDNGQGIAADSLGNVYVVGSFQSNPATFGHLSLSTTGGLDFFVTKFAVIASNTPASLTLQPSNQTAMAGATVTLNVGFIAGSSATFQWRFNGTNIFGATNSLLILTNVGAANAGNYSLVISNSGASVTSATATVTVITEPGFIWAAGIGGEGNDEILGVACDTNGNTYVAGYFSGTATFAGSNSAAVSITNLVSAGGEDIFIAKYGTNQNLIWAKRAGGPGDDRANAIALYYDFRGSVEPLIAGQFSGAADFGGTSRTSSGGTDLFVARYDATGKLSWVQQGGGPANDLASGISILSVVQSGQVFVSGTFQGSANIGPNILSSSGTNDAFIAKFSTSGSPSWARRVGGSGDDRGRAVTCDAAGNSFLCGSFSGTALFIGTSLTSTSGRDTFVMKFDSNGTYVWARKGGTTIAPPSGGFFDDEARAMVADSSGSVFVAGYFHNQATFGTKTFSANSINQPDAFLAKYDRNGIVLWAKPLGGPVADSAIALATDFGGNAYASGYYNGVVQFGPKLVSTAGGADMFVAMYDANGIFQKMRRGGGAGDDVGQAVSFDGHGNAIIGGASSASSTFGETALGNAGGNDAFFTKVNFLDPGIAPIITSQPIGISALFGSNATFTAGVLSSTPVRYQWLFNGAPLVGGTNALLAISNADYTTFGNYSVVISNTFGVVTSAVAILTTELTNQVLWTTKLGSTSDDQGVATVIDAETNVYVAGVFSGTVAFGNSNLTSSGLTDIFLAKYNSGGGLIWARKAGGTLNDLPRSLALDTSGDLLMAGQFQSSTAIFSESSPAGGSGNIWITNANSNTYDAFLAKFDSNGNVLWAKRAGGTSMDQATSVATDGAGNSYVTGSFYNIATFGTISLTNSFNTNFFLAKYDTNGNVLWAKTVRTNLMFSSTNISHGAGVTVDAKTNVFVTGHLWGVSDFGNGAITNTNMFSSFGNATVFVAKYDGNGALQWAKKGGTNGLGFGEAIKADAHGNVYATSRKVSYGPGVFLTKYDEGGNIIWFRTNSISCCTDGYLAVNGLALDAVGNPIIAGFGNGSIQGITNSFQTTGFVLKYRADGTALWFQRCSTMSSAVYGTAGMSVAADPAGNVFVAGRFTGTSFFGATSNLVSSGGNDAFLVKFGVRPPGLVISPSSQNVVAGSNVTLQVSATGSGPFGYQWQKNGTNINGATNSFLSFFNFGPATAGSYTVIVFNTGGSVTSGPAVLTLVPVLKAGLINNNFVINWTGTFVLQISTNLAGPYDDVPAATSPYTNEIDSLELERFFRLRSP